MGQKTYTNIYLQLVNIQSQKLDNGKLYGYKVIELKNS